MSEQIQEEPPMNVMSTFNTQEPFSICGYLSFLICLLILCLSSYMNKYFPVEDYNDTEDTESLMKVVEFASLLHKESELLKETSEETKHTILDAQENTRRYLSDMDQYNAGNGDTLVYVKCHS